MTLNTLESLLADVEAAEPNRLPSKRKEFRAVASEQALLDIRTELAMAAKLHRAGLKFDFGRTGEPSPDLHLRDRDFAIEVTSKTSNGVPQLYDEIEAALRITRDLRCTSDSVTSQYACNLTLALSL